MVLEVPVCWLQQAGRRQVVGSSLPAGGFQFEQHARYAAYPSSSQVMRMPMTVSVGRVALRSFLYASPVPLKSTKAQYPAGATVQLEPVWQLMKRKATLSCVPSLCKLCCTGSLHTVAILGMIGVLAVVELLLQCLQMQQQPRLACQNVQTVRCYSSIQVTCPVCICVVTC